MEKLIYTSIILRLGSYIYDSFTNASLAVFISCRQYLFNFFSKNSQIDIMVIPRVNIPSWEELPFKKGEPVGCAWGLWDDEDEKGTLSLITAETRIAAARLVNQGKSFGLSLPLNKQP